MDANQVNCSDDDHNTNQNEAKLTSRSALSTEAFCSDPALLTKVENVGGGLKNTEDVNKEEQTEGTCIPISILTHHVTGSNNVDIDIGSSEYTQMIEAVDAFGSENQPCSMGAEGITVTTNPNESIATDPPDKKVLDVSNISNGNPSENSNIDISVTSDDSVEVTCRLSSTPNNYSIPKSLNESDCSVSSVGEASPISSIDHSKMSTANQTCRITGIGSSPLNTDKEGDKIDNNIIYLQPQIVSTKMNDNRIHQIRHDPNQKCNLFYVNRNQPTSTFHQNYSENTLRNYPVQPNEYVSFIENRAVYNDYNLCDQHQLTDNKIGHDMQSINISSQPDIYSYQFSPGVVSDREYFVYPSIYVSNAGLISVLLRNDMSVEMTVDRTIRVVSHNHMMAVATDSKGTAASLYHPAAKIFQMGYNTDIATDTFRAKITQGEAIFFSNGINCFKLQDSEMKPMTPIKFSDINRDQSVNLLFSSEGYGESLVATCMQVAAQAEYANLPKGGVIVRINGVKVTQSGCGDVTVVTGAKFIRLSPHNGTTRLGNRFVDIEVERDWSVKLTRGTHSFITNKKRTMVSNGKMEAGFDENNSLKVINLQPRHPLITEPNIIRRPGKRITRTPANTSTCFTPRRRVITPVNGRGGINTC